MAEFLRMSDCNSAIDRIVREAKDKVWLISPFIQIHGLLREQIKDKDRDRIDMRLVYGGGKIDLSEDESEWLSALHSLKIYYRKNLHAKCYMNEDEALITSLNLYEYSQIHNVEWGICVSRREDPQVYQDILKEARSLFRMSERVSNARETVGEYQPTASVPVPQAGVCIRGSEPIRFNMSKPYCDKCFMVWDRFKNRRYQEKACHLCGRAWITSMDRPLCIECYRDVTS